MRRIEEYSVFPYIAWTLIVVFSVYTYGLVQNFNDISDSFPSEAIVKAQIPSDF